MTTFTAVDEQVIDAVRAQFATIGCAQLADAAAEHVRPLYLPLAARNGKERVCGPVFPVVTRNDMLPCLEALAAVPAGRVLFIHNEARPSEALVGDIFVASAQTQRVGGIVVDGAARDLADLAELDVPVFSTEVTFVSARSTEMRATDLPASVEVDGTAITPDDWIFGDADGFLLVQGTYARAVIAAGSVLRAREEQLKAKIRAGQALDELTGLQAFLDGTGDLGFTP